jgi:hypothetical protein
MSSVVRSLQRLMTKLPRNRTLIPLGNREKESLRLRILGQVLQSRPHA